MNGVLRFGKQQDAFDVADKAPYDRWVFAQNKPNGGNCYWVGTLDSFWIYYVTLNGRDRCHYELLREGRPLHLYVDAEAERDINPDMLSDYDMDRIFCATMETHLQNLFPEASKHIRIVKLFASNKDKLSIHYIFKMEGYALTDYGHCRAVMEKFSQILSSDSPLRIKRKMAGETIPTTFHDSLVYTKNRLFRMWLSCKINGNRFLHFADEPMSPNILPDKQKWLDTLVSRVPSDAVLLECQHADMYGKKSGSFKKPRKGKVERDVNGNHPMLKELMLLFSDYGVYSCHESDDDLRLFYLVYSHSCKIAKRDHSHNHVYFMVNLETKRVHQCCWSSGCRGQSYVTMEIPEPYATQCDRFLFTYFSVPLRSLALLCLANYGGKAGCPKRIKTSDASVGGHSNDL